METVSALLAICAGNSPVSGEFPAQRPVTRALMFSLIYARINSWVNNRKAGDLRRHPTHCDVIVMHRSLQYQKHVNCDICRIITRIWSKPSCYSILWSLMDSGSKVYHKNTDGHLAVFQTSWQKVQPWSVSDRYQNAAIIDTTLIRHILLWRCICYLAEH